MICTIAFAVLMAYVIFCAVMCSIQAARQGGSSYSVMLFSIIMTYGGAKAELSYFLWPLTSGQTFSICGVKRAIV